ncbi:MAG: inositol monophosphatase family protein, partial [Anaerolineales bacterium]|nr:hypothetical protein [Anaerolineales bacterium]MDW8445966.1 inositol monophosphatase family protein [Anaerolineales bacterium]
GHPVFAVQYFPALGELYQVELGKPPKLNGHGIGVENPSHNSELTVFACCSHAHRKYEIGLRYKVRILGSAGYSMASVARGAARLAFDAQAKLWDIAGAWLLVPQAKGAITTLNGIFPFPLEEDVDYASQTYPTLAAASPEFLGEGLDKIKPKPISAKQE